MYFNFSLKKTYYIFICIVIVFIILVLFGTLYKNNSTKNVISQSAPSILNAESNEDRIKFINFLGWEVERSPIDSTEISVPENFDNVFLNYNNLQRLTGFDLEKYKGEKLYRYTYKVLNYRYDSNVRINLLVYEGKIVGGDIMSPALDGFMYPLIYNINGKNK